MLVTGKNNVPFIQSSFLRSVPHGFFTRQGGVSSGMYTSLNCCMRDDDLVGNVLKNRHLALESLSLEQKTLAILKQIHGKKVMIVDDDWDPEKIIEADAFVTCSSSFVLGIQTADCVPVLLADTQHRVVAAVHAGWRGALAGVVEETLKVMIALGATKETLLAAIGPAIAQKSYEVGPEVYQMFLDKNPENSNFFKVYTSSAYTHLDLPGYVESLCVGAGIQVERLPYDTYTDPQLFFSCRRAQHEKASNFGGHMSFIAL